MKVLQMHIPYAATTVVFPLGYREVFRRGAFRGRVAELELCVDHELSRPFASTADGSLRAEENDDGLTVTLVPQDRWSREIFYRAERDEFRGVSVGFSVVADLFTPNYGYHVIEAAAPYEVSLTTLPGACPSAGFRFIYI